MVKHGAGSSHLRLWRRHRGQARADGRSLEERPVIQPRDGAIHLERAAWETWRSGAHCWYCGLRRIRGCHHQKEAAQSASPCLALHHRQLASGGDRSHQRRPSGQQDKQSQRSRLVAEPTQPRTTAQQYQRLHGRLIGAWNRNVARWDPHGWPLPESRELRNTRGGQPRILGGKGSSPSVSACSSKCLSGQLRALTGLIGCALAAQSSRPRSSQKRQRLVWR